MFIVFGVVFVYRDGIICGYNYEWICINFVLLKGVGIYKILNKKW